MSESEPTGLEPPEGTKAPVGGSGGPEGGVALFLSTLLLAWVLLQ